MPESLDFAEGRLLKEWTEKYFAFIKEQLRAYGKFVEHVNNTSFIYDRDMLEILCNQEGINIEYTSAYGEGVDFDSRKPMNRIVYSYKEKVKERIK